jgi:putative flippase GtrA
MGDVSGIAAQRRPATLEAVTQRAEILRYGVVGLFNAGTYFGAYAIGVLIGVPYLASSVVAFLLSASLGYWIHEHWTFKGGRPSVRGWVRWLAAQGVGIGVNLVLLAGAVDGLHLQRILAQLVLLPVTPVATYLFGRRYVFTRAAA